MEKVNANRVNGNDSIIIDGVEYFNQNQAALTAGVSVPTFKKRVKEFAIRQVKRPSGRIFYRKQDIEAAISKGWFKKWFM